ncbi:MAG TPA: DUF4252 domain-containing protein [Candidatus Polarisedimenticolaceae bacterium]|nr:DUF4252 domain-containing protein [Candidatus Polarisedimenticolaceae bacterium]
MRSSILRVLAAAALLLATPVAHAAAVKPGSHPGFLSLQPFLDLASPDDDVTEVNVGPELLQSLAQAVDDPEARKMMGGLVAVHAVVLGLTGDDVSPRLDRARRLVADTTKRLTDAGWESVVRVKEKSSAVSVLTKSAGAEGKIHGIAVLVVETDEAEPQVVFANIAGTLEMSQIRRLSSGLHLDLPGLDELGK